MNAAQSSSTVLITGGTGLIGTRLSELLTNKGYKVIHLSRHQNPHAKFPAYKWDIKGGYIDERALRQADYIITLAGAGIADQRWTRQRKQVIIDSRVNGILLLKKELERLQLQPKAIIGASAIGYYGNSGAKLVNESSNPGQGFLTESVLEWEKAYTTLAPLHIRTAIARVGVVLSTKGGALEKMLPTYNFGFGTYFGSGQQIYSWIHIEDVARIFIHLLESNLTGVYNAVAPNPVSNKVLAEAIATAKGMNEVVLPAPALAMKLALGEMAAVILEGSRISSEKVEAAGFNFEFPEVIPALKDLLSRKI